MTDQELIGYNSIQSELTAKNTELTRERNTVKSWQVISAILLLVVIVLLFLYFKK